MLLTFSWNHGKVSMLPFKANSSILPNAANICQAPQVSIHRREKSNIHISFSELETLMPSLSQLAPYGTTATIPTKTVDCPQIESELWVLLEVKLVDK
ncbi:hypothetical protein P7K49_030803 [Saguinus oedipus]|uniref:Uncharacterized protein n=1 Tax=Saguinus oedipus TaxID=9490 RepID=A0ABQ9U369_SAGOE|nr:hypothetical protein P7K49_030803 [Saguinus oedipus]